jgi:hypothetical protein
VLFRSDRLTAEPFARLKSELDSILAEQYGITPAELRPWHYHDPFFQRTPFVYETNLDQYYACHDVVKLSTDYFAGVDLPVDDIIARSDLYEKPGKNPHAFATNIDRRGDVRILTNTTNTERWMETMLHELGHAVVGLVLPNAFPVHKVTIIPRGTSTLGFTESLPLEDRYLITKSELLDNMAQALGGRAAEDLVFGEITTGASSDLERASAMARSMVTQFGMSERLGPIAWGKEEEEVFLGRELTRMKNYSEEIASEIDAEVKKIVLTSYEKAKRVLSDQRKKLDEAAEFLLQKETITGRELADILGLDSGNFYKDDFEEVDVVTGPKTEGGKIMGKPELGNA